jgi:glyoxylase-like metal-dependent hydrolase (beta-lactamase superfamily II)
MAGATSTVTWQLFNSGTLSVPPSFNVGADADLAQVEGELGGVLDERGELACPATFFVGQVQPLVELGLLELVEDGAELLPGVRLHAAPGHTPGQCAVEIEQARRHLLFLADAVMNPIHFSRPDLVGTVDNDPREVEKTRHRLLGRAADEHLLVGASHLWHPGRVVRDRDAFQFIAEL